MHRANGFTRQQILTAVKVHGSSTADDIGRELGISPVAARQHLSALESEGLIGTSVERRGVGRPVHRYSLTSQGDETFPRNYDGLANTLIDELRAQQGEQAVEALLRSRVCRQQSLYQVRRGGKPLRARVEELARIRTEEGYMATAEPNGAGLRLIQRNCAICRVARSNSVVCDCELEMIRSVLGDDVTTERETHILSGDHACVYYIRPRE